MYVHFIILPNFELTLLLPLKDGDGLLSMEELRKCGTKFNSKEIEALFAVGDINSDGEIDINEFLNVMCPAATTVISRIRTQFPSPMDIQVAKHHLL